MTTVKLPYGICNFQQIRNENYLFVDNTKVIKLIEDSSRHALLCRPPLFGKSLLLSTLRMYYDEKEKEHFVKLFGDLWIGKNPTGNQNQYKVLDLDLSICASVDDSMERVTECFNDEINCSVKYFRDRYKLSFEVSQTNCADSLVAMAAAVGSGRLLVLIDDYDSWAYWLLIDSEAIPSRDSLMNKLAPVRCFFEQLKSLQQSDLLDFRTVTVGMSVLPAEISGWNIHNNLTHENELATALGFTEAGVIGALETLGVAVQEQPTLVQLLRSFYNGFDFAGNGATVYNPTQIIYFCQCYCKQKLREFASDASSCDSWSMDRKMAFLYMFTDVNTKLRSGVTDVIVSSPRCSLQLLSSLVSEGAEQLTITRKQLNDEVGPEEVASSKVGLLRYMLHNGMVTLTQVINEKAQSNSTSMDHWRFGLRLPNQVVGKIHLQVISERLETDRHLLGNFWSNPSSGTLKELLESIRMLMQFTSWRLTESEVWLPPNNSNTAMETRPESETELIFRLRLVLGYMCRKCGVIGANVGASFKCEQYVIDLLLTVPGKLVIVKLKQVLYEDIDLASMQVNETASSSSNSEQKHQKSEAMCDDIRSDSDWKTSKTVNQSSRIVGDKLMDELVREGNGGVEKRLRSLKLTAVGKAHLDNSPDVESVVRNADELTSNWKKALRYGRWFLDCTIRRFVVVQVVKPLLVEQFQ